MCNIRCVAVRSAGELTVQGRDFEVRFLAVGKKRSWQLEAVAWAICIRYVSSHEYYVQWQTATPLRQH